MLDLVRLRADGQREILPLTPLFEDSGRSEPGAVLQRWLPEDMDAALSPWEEERALDQRSVVQAMRLADYDHDGRAAEFVLQTAARCPCEPGRAR